MDWRTKFFCGVACYEEKMKKSIDTLAVPATLMNHQFFFFLISLLSVYENLVINLTIEYIAVSSFQLMWKKFVRVMHFLVDFHGNCIFMNGWLDS